MRSILKPIAIFLARVSLVYALLVVPWPGVHEGYGRVYRSAANLLVARLPLDHQLTFRPVTAEPLSYRSARVVTVGDRRNDSYVVARDRTHGTVHTVPWATWWGYLATIFLVALVVSTPLAWRHRATSLICGLLLLNGLIALRITCYCLASFPRADLSMASRTALIGIATSPWYVGPIIIWAAVVAPAAYRSFPRRTNDPRESVA